MDANLRLGTIFLTLDPAQRRQKPVYLLYRPSLLCQAPLPLNPDFRVARKRENCHGKGGFADFRGELPKQARKRRHVRGEARNRLHATAPGDIAPYLLTVYRPGEGACPRESRLEGATADNRSSNAQFS